METIVVIAVMLVGLIVAGSLFYYFDKKRTEAIQQLAESLGLEYVGPIVLENFEPASRFKLFQNGHSRTGKNLLQGETDFARIQIFDYRYTVGSGKNKSSYHQTVVCMTSDSIQCPSFTLSPEGFFNRIGQLFGMKDIDFDEHPEFSNMFQLNGDDEQAIRNFFDRPLLDFFCKRSGQYVESAPGQLIFYRSRATVKPEKWKELMGQGFEVYQAILERQNR